MPSSVETRAASVVLLVQSLRSVHSIDTMQSLQQRPLYINNKVVVKSFTNTQHLDN